MSTGEVDKFGQSLIINQNYKLFQSGLQAGPGAEQHLQTLQWWWWWWWGWWWMMMMMMIMMMMGMMMNDDEWWWSVQWQSLIAVYWAYGERNYIPLQIAWLDDLTFERMTIHWLLHTRWTNTIDDGERNRLLHTGQIPLTMVKEIIGLQRVELEWPGTI